MPIQNLQTAYQVFPFIGIADKAGTPIEDKKTHRENTRKIQKEDRLHTYRQPVN